MKTLVVATGRDEQILKCWVPTLQEKGKYNGEILFLNYDLLESSIEILRENTKIMLKKVEKVYNEISSDRIRGFYERLKDIWQNYDVIMMSDGDLEFFKPIAPLFELAKEKICYVTEKTILKDWGYHYDMYPYPYAREIWEVIRDNPMINTGMIIGPSKLFIEYLKFVTEKLRLEATWGADQLIFNALIYHYKTLPNQPINWEWNYLSVYNHVRENDKCFDENGKEISILHKIGTTLSPKQIPIKNILEGLGIKKVVLPI
jgi:hypothetical protein